MQARDRLIVAADLSTRAEIMALVGDVHDSVGAVKIGLQAFIANGAALVREVVNTGMKVFLDLKIHDIPNTAEHAVAEAAKLGPAMLTVHASGGSAMLRAAASSAGSVLLLGVTMLTSLDDEEAARIGFTGATVDNAVRLARLAKDSGLRGIVASPHEIEAIRHACGRELTIVTPGIRGAGDSADDQRRTLTPREAVSRGADYIVVGRPITSATNRRDAARRIVDDIAA